MLLSVNKKHLGYYQGFVYKCSSGRGLLFMEQCEHIDVELWLPDEIYQFSGDVTIECSINVYF